MEKFFQPEILLAMILICLIIIFSIRWGLKRRRSAAIQETDPLTVPEQTMEPLILLEASLATVQTYKTNLKKYGYPYFQETTPFVLQQLQAEANSLVGTSQNSQQISRLLKENYDKLAEFQQVEVSDPQKLELEVLNHLNKTLIIWRNLLKESR